MSGVKRPAWRSGQDGFSLVEVAVALMVAAVVGGAAVVAANMMVGGKAREHAAAQADQVLARVVEYAAQQHRVPCPDLNGDGHESRADSGSCVSADSYGWIPYHTLGLSRPARAERGLYAVYRGESIDLTYREERADNPESGIEHLVEGLRWLALLQPEPPADDDEDSGSGEGSEDEGDSADAGSSGPRVPEDVTLDPNQPHVATLAGGTPSCADILAYPAVAVVLPGPQRRMAPGGGIDLPQPPAGEPVCLPPPAMPMSARYDGVSAALTAGQFAARLINR
ncbi:MAG: prepilin-type N-terminal cleavage/methylation domain-containing protein [Halothiobacillaceae bacterium]